MKRQISDSLHTPPESARTLGAHVAEEAVASTVLETVPLVMRAIRGQMREGIGGLSVPQFRVLLYVRRHPGTPLSGIAEHLGTTLPAASELVARLVRQGLLTRETDERERRRVCIELTPRGRAGLDRAQAATLRWLSAVVGGMDPGGLPPLANGLRELAEAIRATERGSNAPERGDVTASASASGARDPVDAPARPNGRS